MVEKDANNGMVNPEELIGEARGWSVRVASKVWDDAYSDPRLVRESVEEIAANELLTPEQLKFVLGQLKTTDVVLGIEFECTSVFTTTGNYGQGKLTLKYEREGEEREWVLHEGYIPRQGIKEVALRLEQDEVDALRE